MSIALCNLVVPPEVRSSPGYLDYGGGTQWLSVDLGTPDPGVDRFVLRWAPGAYASSYQIQYSTRPDFSDGGALAI